MTTRMASAATMNKIIKELQFDFARSSGPGGQNVNKVNSKAIMRWAVEKSKQITEDKKEKIKAKFSRKINKEGELVLTSSRFRDQGRNVADCLNKLQEILDDVQKVQKKRVATKPSKGAVERRIKEKKRQGEKKRDRQKTKSILRG